MLSIISICEEMHYDYCIFKTNRNQLYIYLCMCVYVLCYKACVVLAIYLIACCTIIKKKKNIKSNPIYIMQISIYSWFINCVNTQGQQYAELWLNKVRIQYTL